ncbi:DUF1924 domain-containing protein [Phaeospirillum tilakii]|uniref:DUF1924 domain-containing protein n=1 Tax=Phaeospirillum tilakii TaxID=741673 RepID=A0ABW5C9U6_9PROT
MSPAGAEARPVPVPAWERAAGRLWHAALAGGFLVAWLTADEDTYRMHVFAGWWVVGAVLARLALAVVATPRGPLALVRPGRPAAMLAFAALVLVAVGAAGWSGVVADGHPAVEDLHEGLSNLALAAIGLHVGLVMWLVRGRWLRPRPSQRAPQPLRLLLLGGGLAAALLAAGPARAGDPARDALLAGLAKAARAEDPAFTAFSPERGEKLYRARTGANAELAACATCHGDDPTRPGRHAKTGREIRPAALSATPSRFTDPDKVTERFDRDCPAVLGRACSARDRGDYLTFLMSK